MCYRSIRDTVKSRRLCPPVLIALKSDKYNRDLSVVCHPRKRVTRFSSFSSEKFQPFCPGSGMADHPPRRLAGRYVRASTGRPHFAQPRQMYPIWPAYMRRSQAYSRPIRDCPMFRDRRRSRAEPWSPRGQNYT